MLLPDPATLHQHLKDAVEVEVRRLLARWKLPKGRQEFAHDRLGGHQKESVAHPPVLVSVGMFSFFEGVAFREMASDVGPLLVQKLTSLA